jgi:hypothetical protein
MESYYVDSNYFEAVLQNLVDHLHLGDQYTLFILNPNRPFEGKQQTYGYR